MFDKSTEKPADRIKIQVSGDHLTILIDGQQECVKESFTGDEAIAFANRLISLAHAVKGIQPIRRNRKRTASAVEE